MHTRWLAILLLFALTASCFAQDGSKLDKAYLQSIWDGWDSGNVEGQAKFYAQGQNHLYFDVAPLKYDNWDQYKTGVVPVLKSFSSLKTKLNDDLQIHPAGKITWIASTVDADAVTAKGEKQHFTFRWTAIFEKQNGRWVIQHEHVSVPAQGM